jgi:hypothetical protein
MLKLAEIQHLFILRIVRNKKTAFVASVGDNNGGDVGEEKCDNDHRDNHSLI